MLAKRLGTGLAILGAVGVVYGRFVRPWHLHWGATAQEAGGGVAGDDLMPDPDIVATRVVEIDAPPSAIWPWLVQMGPGRGGAYTYDWIERRRGIEPGSWVMERKMLRTIRQRAEHLARSVP